MLIADILVSGVRAGGVHSYASYGLGLPYALEQLPARLPEFIDSGTKELQCAGGYITFSSARPTYNEKRYMWALSMQHSAKRLLGFG